ncbi:FecR domain-containing protein [Bordetella genomosp. 12]|uniref:Iron dicitrate transport regulator FecR n=1 Tax=Bordetella genomosp. 12 TaxID=463035 RepID=A0A261VJV9_9BORD|nr:FecR domain-containing protein [Bordetella genomosp. 12]OZI74426.1 iron dicitrate transport regulator FecR [Bordetella genomosp. 12]
MPSDATSKPSAQALRAINEAAAWYVRLGSETVSQEDQQAWRHWLGHNDANRAAWDKVEQVCRQLGRLPGSIARPTLAATKVTRRAVLSSIGLLAGVGGTSWLGWQTLPWHSWVADYRSAVGERRNISLADGSSMLLDTDTAVDVTFDAEARILDLRSGAIFVTTHPDPHHTPRPFIVRTRQGTVIALGTRFTVKAEGDWTNVAVLEKSVRIAPNQGHDTLTLHAGQQTQFSDSAISPPQNSDLTTASWVTGNLVVFDMPLGELAAELGRYRRGGLTCDTDIAHLLVSGSFPLNNTDQALASLTQSFPIKASRFLGYWTRLVAR